MPLTVTKFELTKLRSGEADGVSRYYPDGCPHKVGAETFVSCDMPDGHKIFEAVIKSIRPETLDNRLRNDRLAKMDGFPNARAWGDHFERMYGPSIERGKVFRMQLILKEPEKARPTALVTR